ncbi:MAG: matrixin family metalloprotease [Planctomycetales bacterium]|nr:matrixin family metalloprotease [Planctomycetales bacterium]
MFQIFVACMMSCAACLPIVCAGDGDPKFIVNLDERWITTASNHAPLQQGDPATLTWNIVADGTPIVAHQATETDGPSNLVSTMNRLHGDDWEQIFVGVFSRYSDLSGLTYIRETADDNAEIRVDGFQVGELGVRADIRIAGHKIDSGPRLAYNHFPENGDMVLDTSDSFLDVRSRIYNLVAHEHGHGLGLRHVYSDDSRLLMEPSITIDFEGPQFDEILGLHRAYGDAFEKESGNDSIQTAVYLGEYLPGQPIIIGDDAIGTRVAVTQTDFVSIDGTTDVDFFSFTLPTTMLASFQLEPAGPTYHQATSNSETQELFDATMQSDLSLQLFRVGIKAPLARSEITELGGTETIENILLAAGEYAVRVAGSHDAAQMYRLTLGEIPHSLRGDFNDDQVFDLEDVQTLIDAMGAQTFPRALDLDSDDEISERDLTIWVHEIKGTFRGDANLDGEFNSSDLVDVFTAAEYEDSLVGNSTWATGDWDGDGDFGTRDLIAAFQDAGFEKGRRVSIAVPEPSGGVLLWICLCSILIRCIVADAYVGN